VLIHYEQCTWGPESAKRPTTKSYVDSLKKMNRQLDQRNRFLERQVAVLSTRLAEMGTPPASNLTLTIPDCRSPPSFGRSSPISTQSEPVFPKTEVQDDIDLIIAPIRHLHVRDPYSYIPSAPAMKPISSLCFPAQ
jgi:hypothetical protein